MKYIIIVLKEASEGYGGLWCVIGVSIILFFIVFMSRGGCL